MKTVMLLAGGPLEASCAVDEYGYILRHKLVFGLDDADLSALHSILALTENLTVCAAGAQLPREALSLALAHGAQQALYVGATDWPEQPLAAAAAQALHRALARDVELLVTVDQGEQAVIIAQLAAMRGLPFYNSLLSVERQGEKLRLLRKLEQGQRQVLIAAPPLALALLPQPSYSAPPGLAAQAAVEESAIACKHISYYDCLRRIGGESPAWLPQPPHPAAPAAAPPSALQTAEARLYQLLQGKAAARAGRQVRGSAEDCAREIVDYLLREGLIVEK